MPLRTIAGTVGCDISAGLKKLTAVVDALGVTTGVCVPDAGLEKLTAATAVKCCGGVGAGGAGLSGRAPDSPAQPRTSRL